MISIRLRRFRSFATGVVFMVAAASCASGDTSDTATPATTQAPSPIETPVETEPPTTESVAVTDPAPPETAAPETASSDTAAPETAAPPVVEVDPLAVHVEGHRGARGLKPENTLQAFEAALDIGVSTLELDLHLTADNVVVVWHDATFGADKCRSTDAVSAYPAEGFAVVLVSAAELADIQCDLNPDPDRFPEQDNSATQVAGNNYQPVTLAALFEFVATYVESTDKSDEQRARAAAVEFNIETKRDLDDPGAIGDGFDGVSPGEFELQTLADIEAADIVDRVVIQSFDHRSLWAIRTINPDVRLAALTSFEPPDLDEIASQGANIWSPNFNVMTKELVDEAHSLGLLVIPWTVNDAASMQTVIDNGADGYITDRPDIAATLR